MPHVLLRSEGSLSPLVCSQFLSLALPVLQLVNDVGAKLGQASHMVYSVLDVDAEVVLGVKRSLLVVERRVGVVVTLLGLVGVEASFRVIALERLRDSPIAAD